MASQEAVTAALTLCSHVFRRHEPVNQQTLDVFVMALEDVPDAEVVEAAKQHVRQGKFFPVPSELRDEEAERKRKWELSAFNPKNRKYHVAHRREITAEDRQALRTAMNEKGIGLVVRKAE